MMKNILEYFEKTVRKYQNNVVFEDSDISLKYVEVRKIAIAVGDYIAKMMVQKKQPILIHMEKSIDCLIAFLGVLYSGNCYVCMDTKMAPERKKNICKSLEPAMIITDQIFDIYDETIIIEWKDINKDYSFEKEENINSIVRNIIDTDPAYILFTSGSTGIPKGSVILHKSVIAYARWVIERFNITQDTTFGSQTPFYFSMSVLDIYATIFSGARLTIIPAKYFSFPIKLIQYLNEKEINTIYWVPSAMAIVAKWRAFEYELPRYLNTILFAGEVMPVKQLNRWRKYIPDALYANLFGPTEITDIALYYVVDREFQDSEQLPIGIVADNMDVFVLNDNNEEVSDGEMGELYFRGSFVGAGYYNNMVATEKHFVQNPLNTKYPEIVYKTGDLVKKEGKYYWYYGRKDHQIKHMGYRIELGEIEVACNKHPEVESVACIYIQDADAIVVYYEGKVLPDVLRVFIGRYLPGYMMPLEVLQIKHIPLNANGKIDRLQLKSMYVRRDAYES